MSNRTSCLFLLTAISILTGCGGGTGSSAPASNSAANSNVESANDANNSGGFSKLSGVGLDRRFDSSVTDLSETDRASGGIAAADYDADGDIDLYVVGGDTEPNSLYQNQGDGTFVDVAMEAGVDFTHWGSGPAFGDIDGDGDLDLFIGSVHGDSYYLLENRDSIFVDITGASGIQLTSPNTFSATFFDYDRDGFVDIFLSHWGTNRQSGNETETVWRNQGDGSFVASSIETGVAAGLTENDTDWSYTPNFSDIDQDGDSDLLMTSDFGESQVFLNNDDGSFTKTTNRAVIVDQNGMGASVGDYDNDGDMDWFVTSIYTRDVLDSSVEGGEELFGNRLYRNRGAGVFEDVSGTAGIEDGGWGWASCFADFDNDGSLDIVHTNGWTYDKNKNFALDRTRYFRSRSDGTFEESGLEVGLSNVAQGRGLVCIDSDRDGDLDLVITNSSSEHIIYFRNDAVNNNHSLTIRLEGSGANRFGIGAWITATTSNGSQVRELGGHNNYVSHNPFEVHFGLGDSTEVDIEVRWPDGSVTTRENLAVDQLITIAQEISNTRLVVSQGDGDGYYDPGTEVVISAAESEEEYHFSHWTSEGGGSFTDASLAETTFTMPEATVVIRANYLPGVAPTDAVSVARRWNEVLLQAIRNDFARPTVHARNLFHNAAAMYDAWATYDALARPYLLGQTVAGFSCPRASFDLPDDVEGAREQAISYAMYRLIRHRFSASPGTSVITRDAKALMSYLGYDINDVSIDYGGGSAAALGNHLAQCYIDLGLADGSNEANAYANVAYTPVNPALEPELPGNPNIIDLNHWQPLKLPVSIDQAGNLVTAEPSFLSPEWGRVSPFALEEADRTVYERDGYEYWVYHDPGGPPTIDGTLSDNYKWAFSLVAVWSSHLQPDPDVMIDISPASLGNITSYPTQFEDYPAFYNTLAGGDPSTGYDVNPVTGAAYTPQEVPLGDYTRVLAEFWADGPDSETPPGHWFVILNTVNEHEQLQKRFAGAGPELGALEWDIKAYFTLGGAMHDAAVTAWGIKGWYDYVRPISSLRAMADRGQSSVPNGTSYHMDGIPLEPGYIEVVETGDALAGDDDEHVGKIKFLSWKGPTFITDPNVDEAGVDWILAENWWPYQRPTFVTPPFAGYISGHSTYSRSAAEVLTALTGDAYFPGGMSGFEVKANEFLVFEEGPSVDMTLQWATYRDASDQCSLSRIWGGIHPPADDIPGRLIGITIGTNAFNLAEKYFNNQ